MQSTRPDRGLEAGLQGLVDDLAERLQRSVALDDPAIRLIVASRHFGDEDALRVQSVLRRGVDPAIRDRVLSEGIDRLRGPKRLGPLVDVGAKANDTGVAPPGQCKGSAIATGRWGHAGSAADAGEGRIDVGHEQCGAPRSVTAVRGRTYPAGMNWYSGEDMSGAEFRECNLSNTRLIGVVMQDAVIDGLVSNLVVNGVEVMGYVEAELDRRHPVRRLARSDDPADLRRAWQQLRSDWAETVARIRQSPGIEHRTVNDEWSAVQTLRHLVFVHDSWFRRCCLGSSDLFTPMGLGIETVPDREKQGLDPSADPTLDEVLAVRDGQAAELARWLDAVTPERLQEPAPVPDNDMWPPYARGRSVRQCLTTVLGEEFEHHQFCVRDLDLIQASPAG